MGKVCLYYFSGSGNTLKVARQVQSVFIERGYECCLINIEKPIEIIKETYTYIGLLFPVAIQSTFPIVWRFVNDLPNVIDQKIFMLDTMEYYSGGVVGPMKTILVEKGYTCVGAKEIKMSTSMQSNSKKAKKDISKNEEALITASQFTKDLIDGKTSWNRIPILSDAMRSISKNRKIWTMQSQKISIDHHKCIMCGKCKKFCPVNAISDSNGFIEIDHLICESCMRCVNKCPKNAFKLGDKTIIQNT